MELVQDVQTGMSSRLLFSEIYYFTLSTVNLFTSSWSAQITSYSMKNPGFL